MEILWFQHLIYSILTYFLTSMMGMLNFPLYLRVKIPHNKQFVSQIPSLVHGCIKIKSGRCWHECELIQDFKEGI